MLASPRAGASCSPAELAQLTAATPAQIAAQMPKVVAAGVNSFKFFFAYKGAMAVGDDLYLEGLLRCKELGALPMARRPRTCQPAAAHPCPVILLGVRRHKQWCQTSCPCSTQPRVRTAARCQHTLAGPA